MHWSWQDVMSLPMPVYRELLDWLADEARRRESGDDDIFDMDAPA